MQIRHQLCERQAWPFRASLPATRLILFSLIAGLLPRASAQMLTQNDLRRQIEIYENTLAKPENRHIPALQKGRIYLHLGRLYQDAGLYNRSEEAFENAIRLFRVPPVASLDLAAAIDGLGTVYVQTGKIADAERAELNALQIREQEQRKPDLAQSWCHLATLYLRENRTPQARDYAQQAVDEFLSPFLVQLTFNR
jgi:tetratricopeptide (TPR) repeat protein